MRCDYTKTTLTVLIGLSLGGSVGYIAKNSARVVFETATATPAFNVQTFAKADDIDCRLTLAQQLPSADAAMCENLANAMLAKRILVDVSDPFDVDLVATYREEYLPIQAWKGLFKRWMKVAPLAAWKFTRTHHSEELPLREAALEQWALIDIKAAVKALGNDITDADKYAILMACLENDPTTGLMLAAEWQFDLVKDVEPFSSHLILNSLLISLAKKSPSAAMEWCQTHAPDKAASVCLGWIENNPSACLNWIKSHPTEQQQHLLNELCQYEDVGAPVVRCLAALTSGDKLKNQITPALIHIAKRDESLAQELIEELLNNPTDRMLARAEICKQLNRVDPRKAMNFILPALRKALPLFEPHFPVDDPFGGVLPFPDTSTSMNISAMAEAFRSYIDLGPIAGVGKNEVLQMLGQFHPQYLSWLITESFDSLTAQLGPVGQWLPPFIGHLSSEEMYDLSENFHYETSEAAWQDAKSLPPGLLRDAIIAHSTEMLLQDGTPIEDVLNKLGQIDGHQANLSHIYDHWMDSDPAAAIHHFAKNTEHSKHEWDSMISSSRDTYFEKIQDMAAHVAPGDLRNHLAQTIAREAIRKDDDFVTSIYWATEITAQDQRTEFIGEALDQLQENRSSAQNREVIQGIRNNLENSSLSQSEKELWLERIDTEISP